MDLRSKKINELNAHQYCISNDEVQINYWTSDNYIKHETRKIIIRRTS